MTAPQTPEVAALFEKVRGLSPERKWMLAQMLREEGLEDLAASLEDLAADEYGRRAS